MRPLVEPDLLWLKVDGLFAELKQWPRVQLKTDKLPAKSANTNLDYQPLPDLSVVPQNKAPMDNLRRFNESFGGSLVFSVESEGRRETLQDLLGRIKLNPLLIHRIEDAVSPGRYIMIGACEKGFWITRNSWRSYAKATCLASALPAAVRTLVAPSIPIR